MGNPRKILWLLLLIPLLSGCVTFYHKSETVRKDEGRKAVEFENENAATVFHNAVRHSGKNSDKTDNTRVGVPFVTFYSKTSVISENAWYNDQITLCDTNGDGTITESEARVYSAMR